MIFPQRVHWLAKSSSKQASRNWEAYCILCNALCRCIGTSTPSLPPDPPWNDILQLAGEHSLTPALAWSLRDHPRLPTDVHKFLKVILFLNRDRNRTIMALLTSILGTLSANAIPSILLKGATSLAVNLYPNPGIRALADIDILVPVERAEEAWTLLIENGFEPASSETNCTKNHQLPPLRHCESGICVEIHRYIITERYRQLLPTENAWRDALPCAVGGVTTQCLDPTTQFVHALAHTQLQDSHYLFRRISLRRMLELAALTQRNSETMNWEDILERFRVAGYYPALQDSIAVIVRLFGVDQPATIAAPRRNPLRVVRARLLGRFAWPDYLIVYYWTYYLRLFQERPRNILRMFNLRRLGQHILYNFKQV